MRKFEPAREALNRSLEIAPSQLFAGRNLGFVELLDSRLDDAERAFERSSAEPFRLMGRALVEHERGHREASQVALDRLIATSAVPAGYQIAEVYAWRGENDEALRWLELSLERTDGGMWYVKFDPLLHRLRGDSRYTALLSKMNLPAEWRPPQHLDRATDNPSFQNPNGSCARECLPVIGAADTESEAWS